MAKEFAFQQRVRDGGAIDGQEGSVTALRVGMQGVGNQLFARPALTGDQNRNIPRRTFADNFIHFLHGLAVPQHGHGPGREGFRPRCVRGRGRLLCGGVFLERAADELLEGFDIKRLDQIVIRIQRGGPDGRFG